MSTKSLIGIKSENGEIRSVYCHWSGYPKYTGAILLKYYNTPEKINSLIDLGAISILCPKLAPEKKLDMCECLSISYLVNEPVKHTFNTPHKGITVAYHRDRGEPLKIHKHYSEADFYRFNKFAEYRYLFKKGKWYVNRQLLTEDIVK